MPNHEGRFHLYSDTSKFAAGSALYQIQNGKPKLIVYASKRLPEAVRSYSITELELCGLAINIASYSYLLKRVDFDAIVDHLALTHIIKSKAKPATTRIRRLLELISSYSFNLYHMEGKDMILSDFLSRQMHDTSNPHEIIPYHLICTSGKTRFVEYPHMFGCPPVCLDAPICLDTLLYVWMSPYVWTPPICLDATIYLDASCVY